MIQLEELRTNLTNIKPELMELRGALDLETGAQEVEQLENRLPSPAFGINRRIPKKCSSASNSSRTKPSNTPNWKGCITTPWS